MLLGRLFVGTGMGLGPPVASLYVTEVISVTFFNAVVPCVSYLI